MHGFRLFAVVAALVLSVFAAPAFVGGLDRAHAVEELGGDFVPLSPAYRVVYTGASPAQPFTSTDSTRTYQVLGVGGIPASNVRAVSVSFAVVGTSTTGYATLWASGTTRPGLPNLMFQPETTPDSNTAMVAVGSDGRIAVSIRQATATATNITLDITGYVTETPAESGGGFVPVTPTRVLATAQNYGQLTDPLPPSGTAEIDLSGVPGIPADAAAAFINIGAWAAEDGVLKISSPSDSQSALAPMARYAADQASSTGLIARLDSAGHLRITNVSTTTSVDIALDVQGFFTENSSSPSGGFTPVTYRLLDTGVTGIPAQGTRDLQLTGQGPIPGEGVAAATLNVTVIDPSSTGFVKLWPLGDPIPPTSNLSFGSGQDQGNLSMVEVGDDGKISIYNGASSAVRVVVDAQGWVAETVDEDVEPTEPPESTSYGVNSDMLRDLETTAADEGISVQAAVDKYGWQDEFGEVIDQLRQDHPDTFSSAEIDPEGPGDALLRFTSAAPADLENVLEDLPSAVNVEVEESAPYTEVEMGSMLEVAAAAGAAVVAGSGDVLATSFEPETGTVSGELSNPDTTVQTATADVEESIETALEQDVPELDTPQVEVGTSDYALEPTTLRGGALITPSASSYDAACTSGFPVRRITSPTAKGVVTAGHCYNRTPYYAWRKRLLNASSVLPLKYGDVQYQQSNGREDGGVGTSFYYYKKNKDTPALLQKLGGARTVTYGSPVCMYGRSPLGGGHNRWCGKVVTVNEPIVTKDGTKFSGMIRVRGTAAAWGGDSGGPAYYGDKAIGIISNSNRMNDTLITPIGVLPRMNLELNY